MLLDPGDYFVITKGVRLSTMASMFGLPSDPNQSDHHDRSYANHIFRAGAVEDTLIAATVVYPAKHAGYSMMVNTQEVDIMTVGQGFVDTLMSGKDQMLAI